MDEQRYLHLADRTFRRIVDAFESIDIEQADIESAGDVLTITWGTGRKAVVNTQRPVRQVWLAGGTRAWHFGWDEKSETWLDERGSGDELFAMLTELARDAGVQITF